MKASVRLAKYTPLYNKGIKEIRNKSMETTTVFWSGSLPMSNRKQLRPKNGNNDMQKSFKTLQGLKN